MPDPKGRLVRRYGLYDLLGDGVAAPAAFIIGIDGFIRWRHVGRDTKGSLLTPAVLLRLQELNGKRVSLGTP
jgi:hypothetical protein